MNILLKKILDLIMPSSCVGCREKGVFVCSSCLDTIDFLEMQECPGCRNENYYGDFCLRPNEISPGEKCRKKLFRDGCSFDQLIVCARYDKKGVLKRVIEQFKYKFSYELAGLLSGLMLAQIQRLYTKCDHNFKNALIVPVPLHKKRLKYRGYNQSGYLAFGLSDYLGVPACEPLVRKVFTVPQAHLKREERLVNLNGAFEIIPGADEYLSGRKIILVDDICTTGSTLNECAKVLKKAGAEKITAVVLARGGRR